MIIPEMFGGSLTSRAYYDNNCPSGYYYNNGQCSLSNWSYWGRWVLAAVIIAFFIVVFFFWSCLSNRRRRSRGVRPLYGTGWMTPGQQQPQYGTGWFGYGQHGKNNNAPPQQQQQQPPPPQYTPRPMDNQYTGQTFNSNEGYYGHHNNDIPLQQPTSAYYPRGGDNVYEPPAGPPPAKR